jgi:acetyl-CoA synthetase
VALSAEPRIIWRPTAADQASSNLAAFLSAVDRREVGELDTWARSDPEQYWQSVFDWLGLSWREIPETMVSNLIDPARAQWFPGAQMNIIDWVFARQRPDHPALDWCDESGNSGSLTYAQLRDRVARAATALADAGVGVGDRVAAQVPMIPDVVIAQLATAWLGAIWVPIFSGFGTTAVTERIQRTDACVFIVADAITRRGKRTDLREHIAHVLAACPTVGTCFVVGDQPQPGTQSWRGASATEPHPGPVSVSGSHPLMVAFTSGTTGAPKGVVLSQAGLALKVASDAALFLDIGPNDRACWITDPGWIMEPIIVWGSLLRGATVIAFDGAPHGQDFWDTIREARVTVLGVSPTLIRSLMAQNATPVTPLPDLRILASSGEPWTDDAFLWFFEHVGGGTLPIINYSGGTEVSGGILTNTTLQPISVGGFATLVPGMGADVVDEAGGSINTGVGELALRVASPGMPTEFWREPGRYEETYWARWPGTWLHGDWVEICNNGTYVIHGRSDNTMKIAGKRVGPAEVENIVNTLPSVHESAAVGVPDPLKGQAIVVFVVPQTSETDMDAIVAEISASLTAELGKPLAPKAIHFVSALPRTRSGKIVRRLILDAYVGQPLGDTSTLENPQVLQEFRDAQY